LVLDGFIFSSVAACPSNIHDNAFGMPRGAIHADNVLWIFRHHSPAKLTLKAICACFSDGELSQLCLSRAYEEEEEDRPSLRGEEAQAAFTCGTTQLQRTSCI
jgi:hypothetical protein